MGFNSRPKSNEKREARVAGRGTAGGSIVSNANASADLPWLISPKGPNAFFTQT